MCADQNASEALQDAVSRAYAAGTPISIVGGGSKTFYGRESQGDYLSVQNHRGIVNYQPTELVLTARAGTPISEIEALLSKEHQMLSFEPPHFGAGATLGGTIACGLSGPRRPWGGAVRDSVLGCRVINGKGELMRFGGEVMKNVAGYDISRLMVGAMGTLGVITEVSLKVLPRPAHEITLCRQVSAEDSLSLFARWGVQPLPISACAHDGHSAYIRLSGSVAGVAAAQRKIEGDEVEGERFWRSVREQSLDFFTAVGPPLWRLSVPPVTPPSFGFAEKVFVDWGGALRWLRSNVPIDEIRQLVARVGGHATLFRGGDRSGSVFHPLLSENLRLHLSVKRAFDPKGILNPGRLYPDF